MSGLKSGELVVVCGRTGGKSSLVHLEPVEGVRRFTCDQLPDLLIEAPSVELAAEGARRALGLSVIGSGVDCRDGRWMFWAGEGYTRPIIITEA